MSVGLVVRRLKPLLDLKSAKLGIALAVISLMGTLVAMSALPSPCSLLPAMAAFADAHRSLGLLLLGAWSFSLFMTVLPFGTVTILLAGYFLGPAAGLVQFIALIGASIIIYEVGRERDPALVEKRLADFPNLARSANLARRKGLAFSAFVRLVPVIPSAVASISASYFGISRQHFLLGTVIAGWCRPVGFAVLGHLGRFSPVCGINPAVTQIAI